MVEVDRREIEKIVRTRDREKRNGRWIGTEKRLFVTIRLRDAAVKHEDVDT